MQLKHAISVYVKVQLLIMSASYFKPYRIPILSKTSKVFGGSIHRLSYFDSSSLYLCLYPWRMEKIIWTDHVRNEDVLLRVNEQRNILHEIRKRKANWMGHILRRNCLLKQVIDRKVKREMEVTRRRERRRKKLLDDPKDMTGYCHLKEEARSHYVEESFWRRLWTCRQTQYWMNEWICELNSDAYMNVISKYRW